MLAISKTAVFELVQQFYQVVKVEYFSYRNDLVFINTVPKFQP